MGIESADLENLSPNIVDDIVNLLPAATSDMEEANMELPSTAEPSSNYDQPLPISEPAGTVSSLISSKEANMELPATAGPSSDYDELRGGLIHANLHFFNLIRRVEASFAKNSSRLDAFDQTLDEVLNTYTFSFPYKEHASEILSYAIGYYIRLRIRQNAYQENQKLKKDHVVKKMSELTNA